MASTMADTGLLAIYARKGAQQVSAVDLWLSKSGSGSIAPLKYFELLWDWEKQLEGLTTINLLLKQTQRYPLIIIQIGLMS